MVRQFAALSLIGILIFCPSLCGAAEVDHGPHRHHATGGAPEDRHAPVHCPEDGDDCICKGAVPSAAVRIPGHDDGGLWFPFGEPSLAPSPTFLHPYTHLTRDGTPTGLAGWGDSLAVCALLQNFRC